MVKYNAKMLNDAQEGVPGSYPFEAPEGLLTKAADEVVRKFFEHVDKDIFHHHVGYEINAAIKSKDGKTVTAMGALDMKGGSHLPYLLIISQ